MAARRGTPSLSAAVQFMHLRRNPICAGEGDLLPGRLTWRFECQPSPLARTYTVQIGYAQGSVPKVIVLDPDLSVLAEGRRIPHVYSEAPMRLCLYLPRAQEWHPGLRIDETIVPWTYLWLDYFEEWLWSNNWKGGGVHPGEGEREAS
jgi:hypothetical protein